MSHALLAGLRHCLRQWPVVLLLYAAWLAPSLIFGAVAWTRLQEGLDRSLAARTSLRDLDLNVFVDLFAHHRDLFLGITIAGLLLGAGSMLVWIWLHAVAVAAAGSDASLRDSLRRAHELFGRFFALASMATALNLLIIGAFYLLSRLLLRWTAEATAELTPYLLVGTCILLAAICLLVSMVVHDNARVRCAVEEGTATTAYRWSWRFCSRPQSAALGIALLVLGAGLLVWVAYQTIAMLIPVTSTPGVIVSLLWGQAFLLVRAACRFWYFAAAYSLQTDNKGSDADLALPTRGARTLP